MPSVGVIVRLGLGMTNVVHYFVLSFSRDVMPRENDLHLLPRGIGRELIGDKILQMLMETSHELCTRGNAVGVEPWFRRKDLAFLWGGELFIHDCHVILITNCHTI